MKGIEKITARIAADAEAEDSVVRKESEERIAQIRADYEKQAQEAAAAILKDGAKENEQHASRIERTAQLEAKRNILGMKQEMVSKAFELAKEKIVNMPQEEYVAFLVRQIRQAASTGHETLILNQTDRERCGAAVIAAANAALTAAGKTGALTLAEETRPMSGGFILKQGDVEVNCTVDILLELVRGDLAAPVAGVLFEG
ncbi:MAG: V-type ATP synthase subunit E [Oscillospiraceae bacterium]|nr:V-type ATP synthase subunit E [Oscillospiraceae bacterium]